MKRTVTAPVRSSRTARGGTASAKLRPPLAEIATSKVTECVLPVPPYVPSVDQNLECCLLGLRDCLTKMRQTEVTDRAIRTVGRVLKML